MIRLCLFLILLGSTVAHAANLDYSVRGLKGELKKNVLAHLGDPPDTPSDRLNFVVSARERVQSGLKALGYYQPDIKIEVHRTDPLWQLDIKVDPGDPVHYRDISIQILGQAADDDEFTRLISNAKLSAGESLHHGEFERFRNSVLALGQQRGYLDGEIKESRVEVEVDANAADVYFLYESGQRFRFGDISYNQTFIDPALFDALITIKKGEYFDQVKLTELQSQLQRTNYFSSVVIEPLRNEVKNNTIPIAVKLHPAKRHNFDVGVGYATDTEERISMAWRTPKINRFGHSQVTRLEYSPVNPSGRFTYAIPITHPLNDIVYVSARAEENEYGDIDSRLADLGVRREKKHKRWVYGYSLRGLTESWELLDTKNSNDYLLVGGSVSSRIYGGSQVDPSSGFNQLYTVEAGNHALGSDIDLLRFTGDLRYIFTPWPRSRIVSRAELGVVEIANGSTEELAPSLSFFAGGSQSIRGYSYQSIGHEVEVEQSDGRTRRIVVGGDRLLAGSLEYQYYFTGAWRGALFVDAGDAFDEGDFDTKVGAGFGVHYITQVGAIRVELANSVSEQNPDWYFHLSVGAEF